MNDKTVQIKLLFTNYESAVILQHLISHIECVKRNFPHLHFKCPTLTRNIPLVQFKQNVQIPAYDLYIFNVNMVRSFIPQTRIYFTGTLSNSRKLFPSSYPVTSNTFQPQETVIPIFSLLTRDGSIYLPSLTKSEDAKPFVLHAFNLHISIEHLQFAQPPFTLWEPIQTYRGMMSFPSLGSTLHTMPSITNPIPENSFSYHH